MEHLTPQQQKLVEDNHNLIYSLAYKKNINLDEFYGDLAIGLCKAALAFDEIEVSFQHWLIHLCITNIRYALDRSQQKE